MEENARKRGRWSDEGAVIFDTVCVYKSYFKNGLCYYPDSHPMGKSYRRSCYVSYGS